MARSCDFSQELAYFGSVLLNEFQNEQLTFAEHFHKPERFIVVTTAMSYMYLFIFLLILFRNSNKTKNCDTP